VIRGAWLTAGAHVNLVGAHTPAAREIDTEGMVRGRLFVDARASALLEAGDILLPLEEGALQQDHIVGEMGGVIKGACKGRLLDSDITIFKSLGHVAQDLFIAAAILDAAKS
jgi:ornithine cyclodeaminase